jgi:hypothetical protein
MARAEELKTPAAAANARTASGASWLFSWPLSMGLLAYLYLVLHGDTSLRDGDTYWHIAAGQWILQNGAVPAHDPFSHTMRGAVWTAHEWLSEVVLAGAHQLGGWTVVVALTALAFAATIALLTRALLRWLEPIYALMFAGLAVFMTAGHALARPHMLAMPLMMLWTIELVRASEAGRAPRLWLLPVMTLWANLHGGFTLGIGLAFAFALEALLAARQQQRVAAARSWGIFLALAVASSLVTPHGTQGLWFTWQIMFEDNYALGIISEWQSPNFHIFQPLEVWLLAGLALVMYQGLRLPAIRLLLLLGLLHLSLKHNRNIELLGLLAPLILASPFAAQWRQRQQTGQQLESADRILRKLAQPAGRGAILVSLVVILAAPLWMSRSRPFTVSEATTPALAVQAVQKAGIKGPVLNGYPFGGYLIYAGIPPFIDSRSDMYRDVFLKSYVDAIGLRTSDGLQDLLAKYEIKWTLLETGSTAVAFLDQLPGWRRLYADKTAVVHVRESIDGRPDPGQASRP